MNLPAFPPTVINSDHRTFEFEAVGAAYFSGDTSDYSSAPAGTKLVTCNDQILDFDWSDA